MSVLAALRQRLEALVAFDTQNPHGDEAPMVRHLARELQALDADRVSTFAVGRHHAVLAHFGAEPRLLINAHVDTVPANSGYSADPHHLVEREGRLYGLGSADTKGAIAAILEALAARRTRPQPKAVAVLFSGDEERSSSVAGHFIGDGGLKGYERVIVCEPTGCRVGHRHRGIGTFVATATSAGGHSSRADLLEKPIVVLAKVAVALDGVGQRWLGQGPPGFLGLCLNVAAIDGGVAFNVVPTQATLKASFRPGPGIENRVVLAELEAAARAAAGSARLDWQTHHDKPAFATRDLRAFAGELGTRVETPVDLAFWTEAALFSAAGLNAVVFGPGHIEQAHAGDEYIETTQLETAYQVFLEAFS